MGNEVKQLMEFGPFRIDPAQRLLFRDQQPISLPPKTFDLLLVLAQRSGQVVLKDDLMKTLWPDTFVEESNLGQQVFQLRKALGDRSQDSSYIVTVPGRGYRFVPRVNVLTPEEELVVESHTRSHVIIEEKKGTASTEEVEREKKETLEKDQEQIVVASRSLARVVVQGERRKDLRMWLAAAAVIVAIVANGGLYWRSQRPKLTEKDTIVLAEFDNKTGDTVFDGTLRQGLSAQLGQSPFLNLLSDSRISQTLSLMTQPKDSRLGAEAAREVCQRTRSAAVLNGTIAQIGVRYLLTLKAVNCSNGESLAGTSAEAGDKNHVLDALGRVATDIRGKLGESLASVQ